MTTRETMRRQLCGWWWRLSHGSPAGRFSIPTGGLKPQHLAIVLPTEFHDFDVAQKVLLPLTERLHAKKTTILVRENFRTWLPTDQGWNMITFDSNVRNFLGFPKGDILDKLAGLEPEVVIDLTPSFNPYTAAIAVATRAPLRISLDLEQDNDFYNFFIQFEDSSTLVERYNVLLRYV